MNLPNQLFEAGSESHKLDPGSRILHLLAGLERQKEELGPIAVELIDLLHRLGVDVPSQTQPPQANDKP